MRTEVNRYHLRYMLVRQAIILAALIATLYVTANKFDSTELRTIIIVFLASGSSEGIPALIEKIKGKPDQG